MDSCIAASVRLTISRDQRKEYFCIGGTECAGALRDKHTRADSLAPMVSVGMGSHEKSLHQMLVTLGGSRGSRAATSFGLHTSPADPSACTSCNGIRTCSATPLSTARGPEGLGKRIRASPHIGIQQRQLPHPTAMQSAWIDMRCCHGGCAV